MDFAGLFKGKMIVIVRDSRCKWIEAFPTQIVHICYCHELSRTLFAQFGVPEVGHG